MNATVTIGQSRPCIGTSSVLEGTIFQVITTPISVAFDGCVNVFLGIVSANAYRISQTVKLSSNLVSFKKIEQYSAYNLDGATVGNLVGNGVEVEIDGAMNDYTICIDKDTGKIKCTFAQILMSLSRI